MRRRDFIVTAAALAGGGAALFAKQQRVSASVAYPGRELGHWLRDARSVPAPSEEIQTEVLIAGSGVAGLSAAWGLKKAGVQDLLTVSGPETYGNAASGQDAELQFPTGAHYLPLPSLESSHIREMLHEFGVIQSDPFGARPTFDERFVVHGPTDRVLYNGAWQDGYLPSEGVSIGEREEHKRFFDIVDFYTSARGTDGKRAFAVPLECSSMDDKFRDLDKYSFRTWLQELKFTAPTLYWYLDYCCRDDYGRHLDEISAWAGLHYFCSRNGLAANAARGAVLTWPQGLSALTAALAKSARVSDQWLSGAVTQLRITGEGVEALVISPTSAGMKAIRVHARYAVAAMPLYVLQHIFKDSAGYGFVPKRDVPRYAPWMVSNFIMHAFPEEQPGAPLAWDNVIYKEPGLGYVVSTHQDIRMSRPDRTAFTAYHALSDMEPEIARHWLDRANLKDLTTLASQDLGLAYGWRLPMCLQHVAITVRAHGMAVPEPGFLHNPGRLALRSATGPIFFAHSDLSGLSLFEEASWWGYRAAQQIITARQS